jgi:hypothetical protein
VDLHYFSLVDLYLSLRHVKAKACHKMNTPNLLTQLQGQTQNHTREITHKKKDKLYYTINILLIKAAYGSVVENKALKTTLDIRPLLAMMIHTGTK